VLTPQAIALSSYLLGVAGIDVTRYRNAKMYVLCATAIMGVALLARAGSAQTLDNGCRAGDNRSRALVDSALLSPQYADFRRRMGIENIPVGDIRPLDLPADSTACRHLRSVGVSDQRPLASYRAGRFFVLAPPRSGMFETYPVIVLDGSYEFVAMIISH
jgi:hypothetical protein